jgi:hypothetical protein
MKTILVVLSLTITAAAQDLSEPQRSVAARPVNLTPLFQWWTNATAIVATNAELPIKKKLPLPERPLKHWVRITTQGPITNNGFAWFAEIRVQEIPGGPSVNKTVVLRSGPFEEKKQFDSTVAQLDNTIAAKRSAQAAQRAHENRADTLFAQADASHFVGNVFSDGNYHSQARSLAQQSRAASAQAAQAGQRAANLDRQRAELLQATRGRRTLALDNFAMNSGLKYNGLEVYEIGLRYGR